MRSERLHPYPAVFAIIPVTDLLLVFIDQTFISGLAFSPSPGRLLTLGVESVIQTGSLLYLSMLLPKG